MPIANHSVLQENHIHFWIVLSLLLIFIHLVNAATSSLPFSTEYISAALSFGRRHYILSEVKAFFVQTVGTAAVKLAYMETDQLFAYLI